MVIGAAVLLFIASFLDTIDDFGDDTPMAWDNLGLVMSVYVAGIAGAALIVVARGLPNQPKVLGIDLGQAGVVLTVASAWGALWSLIDPGTFVDGGQNVPDIDAGAGLILGFIAALVLAAAAVATLVLPALKAPLAGTPGQAAPQPTAASRRAVTATPVASRSSPSAASSPTAPRSRASRSSRRPRPRPPRAAGTSPRSGSRCRWPARSSVRTVRRRRSPNWPPVPGTWPSSSAVRT